jgi:hypothetical protein
MKLEVFGFLIEDGKQPLPERLLGHIHAFSGVKHVKSFTIYLEMITRKLSFFRQQMRHLAISKQSYH